MRRLTPFKRVFQCNEYIEPVLDTKGVKPIADELEEYLRGQYILAYHCTKQPVPGFFEARGLRLTDVHAHQQEFLAAFAGEFTQPELANLQSSWDQHFMDTQLKNRNGRIWACLTRELVLSEGARWFFKFYGGESIYFPMKDHPTLASKLEALGEPVVVEFAVQGAELVTFYPLALPVLGALLRSWNTKEVAKSDLEAHIRMPVHTQDILVVSPLAYFEQRYRANSPGTLFLHP